MNESIVYVTNLGKVEERTLVNETPKGFRVKRWFRGVESNGTSMELAIQYRGGFESFGGEFERFEIATLDKDKANSHAKHQRRDIANRIVGYQDYWLKHIGLRPADYKEMLNMALEMSEK